MAKGAHVVLILRGEENSGLCAMDDCRRAKEQLLDELRAHGIVEGLRRVIDPSDVALMVRSRQWDLLWGLAHESPYTHKNGAFVSTLAEVYDELLRLLAVHGRRATRPSRTSKGSPRGC